MTKGKVLFIILATIILAGLVASSDFGTKKEYYDIGADHYATIEAGTNLVTQTFTVGTVGANEDFSISMVNLSLYRVGNPGMVNVAIREVDGGSGKPVGGDLTKTTFDASTLTTNAGGEWKDITLPPYTLLASTKYAIVLIPETAGGADTIKWRADASSPIYIGGSKGYSINNGASWTMEPNIDLMFQVWGKDPVFDIDGDGVLDNVDNCRYKNNSNQEDSDGDCPPLNGSIYIEDPKCGDACDVEWIYINERLSVLEAQIQNYSSRLTVLEQLVEAIETQLETVKNWLFFWDYPAPEKDICDAVERKCVCEDECSEGEIGCDVDTTWYCGEGDNDDCLEKIHDENCNDYDKAYCQETEIWQDNGYCLNAACEVDSSLIEQCAEGRVCIEQKGEVVCKKVK